MTTNTSKPVNRVARHFGGEDLGDRVYEMADKMASTLLRLLERHQQQRCEALVSELERIEQELTSLFNEEPEAEAGLMPRPRKLGFLVRWDRQELENWLADGCPAAEPPPTPAD